MGLGLAIERWAFWSPATRDPRQWQASSNSESGKLETKTVPGDLIPMMHRRRMSVLCKMGVQVALEVDQDISLDYLVFCSQHGEVARSETLIECMTSQVELSPTDFSLSVHNTTAGVYTIIRNSTLPSTSIASGTSSFASGWLEAEAYLHQNPAHRVLLVDHDNALPPIYRPYLPGDRTPYALALVVSVADEASGVSLGLQAAPSADEVTVGPNFLSWWLSDDPSVTVAAEQQGFQWTR